MRTLYVCYALSGVIGLGYQVVWLRHFVDRFGSSTFTFVLVVCSFIGGLGIGALASRKLTELLRRALRDPGDLVLYGAIELAIAAGALLVLAEGWTSARWIADFPYELRDGIYEPLLSYQLARIPLTAASVLVPCVFMGATYPLLCHAFREAARLPAALYAWNTLGACTAVLLCEWLLLRHLGTDRTFAALGIANVALGLYFLARGRRLEQRCRADLAHRPHAPVPARAADARAAAPATLAAGGALAGAALSGALSGLLEADAFRRVHFAQIFNGAAMAYVSFWAIAAIFLASWTIHARPRWKLAHVRAAYLGGLVAYVLITRFLLVPAIAWVRGVAEADPDGVLRTQAAVFAAVGAIAFPPYYCASLLLPYVCNAAQAQGRHLGRLYGLNTLAFLAGMIAFSWGAPSVNVFYAFRLAAIAFLVIAAALFLFGEGQPFRPARLALPAGALALAAVLTPASFDRGAFPATDPLHTVPIRALKGSPGFSSFVAAAPDGDALYLDSGRMSNTSPWCKRYMKVMAHFPLLAQEEPSRALLICFGVGNTASAIAKHRTIRELDIVDLARNVLETAPEFAFHNDSIATDPRVRRIHDDGRSFLDVTSGRYDLVTSEPPPPLMHGISRLYSIEYYDDVAAHLAPHGFMTQWLPIYQMPPQAGEKIVATFLEAFPHALLLVGFETELLLVGSVAPIDLELLARRFGQDPAVLGDLHDVGVPSAAHLLARIAMTDAELRRRFGSAEVITDQKNPLSAYWPTGRILAFPFDPEEIARSLPAGLGERMPELRAALGDLRALRRCVPDFPADSLAAAQRVQGTEVPWLEIQGLNRLAESALQAGAVDQGFRIFDRSLALLPEQMAVFLSRGSALVALGRPAEAIAWFERATQGFAEFQDGWIALASAQAKSGRFDAAIASARAALERNPRSFQAQALLGGLLRHQGDLAGAAQHLELALELKPMAENLRQVLAAMPR